MILVVRYRYFEGLRPSAFPNAGRAPINPARTVAEASAQTHRRRARDWIGESANGSFFENGFSGS